MSNEEGKSTAGSFDPAAVAQAQLEDLKNQENKREILKDIAATLGNNLEVAKQEIELDRIRLNAAKNYLKDLKTKKDFDLNAIENQSKIREEFDKLVKATKLSTNQQAQLNALQLDSVANIEQAVEKIEEFRSKQEISKDFADDIASGTAKLARNMGIAADFSKTAAGKFTEMGAKFFSGDRAANGKAIMGAISGMVSPANMLASLLDIAVSKMLELNKAAIGLKVATGYSNDFQSEMTAVAATTSKAGVTLEASNAAFTSLTKGITGINLESGTFRKNLSTSAGLMTKLGVSADTSAKNFNLLLKTFKMTDTDTTRMMESMAAGAEQLGMSAEDLGKEFNSAMGYLSSFGKEGVKAFEDLASQAAVSGVAISKLLGMTKAFDKFGEGAKKAATMNAVLGTSLSSMALMAMNPAERMKEMRKQINMATGGVNQMTQAQKLFTAEAMGYSSVAEMMADLQADPAKMRERAAAAKAEAEIQERMADAMTELLPLMDRVSMAFEALATNEAFVNALGTAVEFLVNAVVILVENIDALLIIGAGLMMWTSKMSLRSLYLGYSYGRATGQLSLHTLATKTAAFFTSAWSAVTGILTGNMTLLAFATNLTMGKILLFIGLAYLLIKVFTKPNSPPLYLIFGVVAISVLLLGAALNSMGPMAIVAALALALLAGAISLIFYGMAALVESITGLFTTMSQSVDTMPVVILGIFALGAAFLFLGYAATFSSTGIFLGLAALTAMFLLFKLTGTSMADMFGAGDEILKIGIGIEKFGQGLNNIRTAVGEIKGALGDDGLFAASIGPESSSLVVGSGVSVAKLFKNNKIEVEVKMPEVSIPKINVNVYIGNEELKTLIRKEVNRNKR